MYTTKSNSLSNLTNRREGSKSSAPFLSIVIPVYNEEENLDILYKEIRRSVDFLKKPYEIIFVDDGSSDKGLKRLKTINKKENEERALYAQTRVIRLSRNFGQTAAMQAGFDHSIGNIIVSLDADLQNDPCDIPRLLVTLDEGYDVVCGWRKQRKDNTLTRILPSKVANWLIAKITRVPIHDNGCSLKAYRSTVIKSVRLYSDLHRFIPAVTTLAGAKVAEIEVNHRPRKYGKAKYGLSRVWKVLFDIVSTEMLIHFHDRPLLWFAFFAFIFALVGIGFSITSVLLFLNGARMIVYPAISFLVFFLSGSLFFWGLLGEFLLKVESCNKKTATVRPFY